MKSYRPYVKSLKKLVFADLATDNSQNFEPALNGQPYAELRSCITIQDRRECGAFFTNHELAHTLVKPLSKKLAAGEKIIDPTCGTGNLLLACARYLPLKKTLRKTVNYWGKLIHGYDIHKEFVETAKLRLLMVAIQRHGNPKVPNFLLPEIFPNIEVRDSLESVPSLKGISIVLLNPPYTRAKIEGTSCEWAKGSTSVAALFVERYTRLSATGTHLIAILPDVLRTGSLYKKWRERVSENTTIKFLSIKGLFDQWTDIDVFVARLEVSRSKNLHRKTVSIDRWKTYSEEQKAYPNTLEKYFTVSVGPVVPHRHDGSGSWKAYLHVKNCPPREIVNIDTVCEKLRFSGTVFKPPFVVIRRTSRPQEKQRVIATVIKGSRDVAVENHLIVLTPAVKTLKRCKEVAEYLNSGQADEWLNWRLRCRHLTTSAIKEMPVPEF